MHSTLERTPDGRMPYFPALDGVRAYCVLLVMFDHLKSNGHGPGWINGHLGVDLFFLLSGFLITTLLAREHHFTGRIDRKAFFLRRIFRILPAYVAVLLIYVAVLHMPSQAPRWTQFRAAMPWFLTLTNEFAREPRGGTVFLHTWSLGVEEKFYLVWPFLFLPGTSSHRRRVLFAGLLACLGAAALLGQGYLARAYFGLLTGSAMAFALAGNYGPRFFAALRRVPPSLALAIFLAGVYAEHVSKDLMFVFSFTSVFFLGTLIARESWLARLHHSAPLVWLGKRSYSMYLLHLLCLNALEARVSIGSGAKAASVLALAYAGTALAAEVLYRLVEQPARSFGRRFLARHHEIAAAL